MESQSFDKKNLIREILRRLCDSCDYIIEWNRPINSPDDYPISSSGMQILAASCMLIETIGEGIKSIDKRDSEFLETNSPDIPWRDYVGIRNRIAHGYHEIDESIVYDVVKNDIPELKNAIKELIRIIEQ